MRLNLVVPLMKIHIEKIIPGGEHGLECLEEADVKTAHVKIACIVATARPTCKFKPAIGTPFLKGH